jgi:hypothetical protein
MSGYHSCLVSFTDMEGVTHSEVAAASLYEAAGLAVAKFRQCEFHGLHIGPGTVLRVVVKQPETVHELRFGKLQEWLEDGGTSLKEHAVKVRIREVLKVR